MTPTDIAAKSAKEYVELTSDIYQPEIDTARTFHSTVRKRNSKDEVHPGIVSFTPTITPIPERVYFSHGALVYPHDRPLHKMMTRGMGVADAYNWAVGQIVDNEEKFNGYDFLLTIEHDNCPGPNGLLDLLDDMIAHPEYAAIGGLYYQKGGVAHIWGDPTIGEFNQKPMKADPDGGLVECCATALGFTLFRLDMFRDQRLRRPWFKPAPEVPTGHYQEIYMWQNARILGYRCAVDCSVKVGHFDSYSGRMW